MVANVRITLSSSITVFVLWMMYMHLLRRFIWCRLFNINTWDMPLLWLKPPRERAVGNRGVDAARFPWSIWKYLEVSESCRKLGAVKACGHNVVILGGIYRTFEQPSCEAWGKVCQFPLHCNLEDCCKLLQIVAMDSPCLWRMRETLSSRASAMVASQAGQFTAVRYLWFGSIAANCRCFTCRHAGWYWSRCASMELSCRIKHVPVCRGSKLRGITVYLGEVWHGVMWWS